MMRPRGGGVDMTGEPDTAGRLDRRAFLRAGVLVAGLGAGSAALAACGGSTGQPSQPSSPVKPTTPTAPGPIDYAALGSKLSGHLLRPGQSGYSAASRSYNPLFDDRQPAAIALCAKPADVQA